MTRLSSHSLDAAPAPGSPGSPGAPGSAGHSGRISEEMLAASFAYCRRVARSQARNFYYGMMLTPEPRRSALYTIYVFMRACDDLADDAVAGDDVEVRLQRIERFRADMVAAREGRPPPGPLWPAFRHVMNYYPIDARHLHAMLDGQAADLRKHRYANFNELRDYCYKVASVVGLVCISVWGHDGEPGNEKMAEERGVALQLTNILRDVVEDARRDRVYLPETELARFGFTADSFKSFCLAATRPQEGERAAAFAKLMQFQIDRARRLYERSEPLNHHVDRPCRPTIWAVTHIYRRLLEKIAADPTRVLRGRVRLSRFTKAFIAARALFMRGLPTRK